MPNSNWLPGEPTTLLHMFRNALRKLGENHQFLDYAGVKHSLGELDRKSDPLARGLRSLGVEPGQTAGGHSRHLDIPQISRRFHPNYRLAGLRARSDPRMDRTLSSSHCSR
jgi:hypothetical protein